MKATHLSAYSLFKTSLSTGFTLDERKASVEGFQADNRYIFAFHIPVTASDHLLDTKTGDSPQLSDSHPITLTLPELMSGATQYHARVVPLPGSDHYPAETSTSGRDLIITFAPPIHPGETAVAPRSTERVFYLVVEQQ